jgi:hypothetical protein
MKQCESLCVSTASQASQRSMPQYAQRNQTPGMLDMQRSHRAAGCCSVERYVCGSIPGGGPAGDLYLWERGDQDEQGGDEGMTHSLGRKAKGDTSGRWTGRGSLKNTWPGSCIVYEFSSHFAH